MLNCWRGILYRGAKSVSLVAMTPNRYLTSRSAAPLSWTSHIRSAPQSSERSLCRILASATSQGSSSWLRPGRALPSTSPLSFGTISRHAWDHDHNEGHGLHPSSQRHGVAAQQVGATLHRIGARRRTPTSLICHGAGAAPYSSNGASVAPVDGYQSELHTVNVAIVANVLIFIAKMVVWAISGSSAMLAEGIHSLADVGNQVLLRTGVMKAKQSPTTMYPYGFTRDKFVWSLISAVGIFCCGAGVSFLHGVHGLFEERVVEHLFWNLVVLSVSALLEGYSLWVAFRTVMAGATAKGIGVMDYLKRGMDPTSTAVLLEDGGAVAGLFIAGACTVLTHVTGNVVWDSVGSIAISFLLGSIAIFLIQRNRSMLIGRSMNPTEMSRIMEHLRNDTVVRQVFDAKSEEIGPGLYRFKAEIEWRGDLVVERYLKRCGRDSLHASLKAAVLGGQPEKVDAVLKVYGKDIISAVGVEVDRIEAEITTLNPGVLYVDLETDRGRYERGNAMSSVDGDFCYVDPALLEVDNPGTGSKAASSRTPEDSALWPVANSVPHKPARK